MFVFRWMRSVMRAFLGFLTVAPIVALLLAAFLDRGPAGEVRLSFFPAALLTLNPFVWTCARNSVIFAVVVTSTALIAGVILASILGGLRAWGRRFVGTLTALFLAASPMVLALGLVGTWGMPQPWPWPISAGAPSANGVSLESLRGGPLWVFWIWSTLPGAVALVMLAIAPVIERIAPEWGDASRLSGAGGFQTWRRLIWPLIRPAAARAAALVFPLALVEPGATLILGLRRTLAFQIIEAAGHPDPFPHLAGWAMMAGLISLIGRFLILRWGGSPIVNPLATGRTTHRDRPSGARAGFLTRLASVLTLTAALALGWLPVPGLFRLVLDPRLNPAGTEGLTTFSLTRLVQQVVEPPIPRLAYNSLFLGLEIATGVMLLAWVVRPTLRGRSSRSVRWNLFRPLAQMPPLLQAVGILAIPWLAGVVSASLRTVGRFEGLANRLAIVARELSPERNPWMVLSLAVGLTVGLRFLRQWLREADLESNRLYSGQDAALIAGASRIQAEAVASWRPARGVGRFLLVAGLVSTCLTPALLFTPWIDERIIAPGIVILADGPDDIRIQAAILALAALGTNMIAMIAARVTKAWPVESEIDRI